jgi:hypothetical protein
MAANIHIQECCKTQPMSGPKTTINRLKRMTWKLTEFCLIREGQHMLGMKQLNLETERA